MVTPASKQLSSSCGGKASRAKLGRNIKLELLEQNDRIEVHVNTGGSPSALAIGSRTISQIGVDAKTAMVNAMPRVLVTGGRSTKVVTTKTTNTKGEPGASLSNTSDSVSLNSLRQASISFN
jgi:hypothetical protein